MKDNDEKHECGGFSIGPLTSGDIKVKTQYKMFEKMYFYRKITLYLNFDEALNNRKRDPKVIKKRIIIVSTYCEDLAKIFQ